MLSDGDEQYHYWTMVLSLKRLEECKQGPKETVEAFYNRWTTQVQVHKTKWGSFTPTKVFSDQGDTSDKHLFQACLFLHSIDQIKYGDILHDLNNSFLCGNKKSYPATADEALSMITQWMGVNSIRNKQTFEAPPALTFAQHLDHSDHEAESEEEKTSVTQTTSTHTDNVDDSMLHWQY